MTTDGADLILWQENKETGVGEPALAITAYSDVIQIEQGSVNGGVQIININYDSVAELCRELRKTKPKTK